jgi:hypothetical protein
MPFFTGKTTMKYIVKGAVLALILAGLLLVAAQV